MTLLDSLIRHTSRRSLRSPYLAALAAWATAASAFAQSVDPTSMGQGFFAYARPYVIWAGAGMVLLCVAAALFFKPLLKDALITAGIVVMLVFLFNTFPDLVRALSH
jgi:multidrug transporter EmrE-like cation transporter